ncbi:hypothetical protein D3C84_484260 [compost metagenome]
MVSVLSVASHAAPDDRAGGIGNRRAVTTDTFAIGLHVHLLQMLYEVAKVVVIGQERITLRPPKVVIPDPEYR